MDFLVARMAGLDQAKWPAPGRTWSRLSKIEGELEVLRVKNFLIAAPNVARASTSPLILFDGHATVNEQAFSSGGNAPPSQESLRLLLDHVMNDPAGNNICGVFVLVSIDIPKGSIKIYCDPLSQYNLFQSMAAGYSAFSNNIYFLEAFLEQVGAGTSRSFSVAAHESLLGFGALSRTGLTDVLLVPADHAIQFSLENNTCNHVPLKRLTISNRDRPVSVTETAASLAASIKAIHKQFQGHDIVYDVTGGYDSRLVLAGSMKAGITDQMYFRSDGAPAHDVAIPDYIAAAFNLSYAGFPQNFDGEKLSALDFARRAVFRQQAQSTIYANELGRFRVSNVVRIRGGVSGALRANYNPKMRSSISWRAKRALRAVKSGNWKSVRYHLGMPGDWRLPSGKTLNLLAFLISRNIGDKKEYFTDWFRSQVTRDLAEELHTLWMQGTRESALLNSLYLVDRSRRHFGLTSQMLNGSRPTFEPLANYDLWRLGVSYSPAERAAGCAIFDLMTELQPALLDVPYAPSSFDKSHLSFKVFGRDQIEIMEPRKTQIKSLGPPQIRVPKGIDLAGLTGHQKRIIPVTEEFFDLLFSVGPASDTWRYLDRNAFERVYRDSERDTIVKDNALMFMRLLHGLIWLHGLEDRTPIEFTA